MYSGRSSWIVYEFIEVSLSDVRCSAYELKSWQVATICHEVGPAKVYTCERPAYNALDAPRLALDT